MGLGLDPGLKVGPEVGPDPRVDRGRGPDLKVGQDLVQVHLAVQDPGRKVPLQGLIKSVHFVSFRIKLYFFLFEPFFYNIRTFFETFLNHF